MDKFNTFHTRTTFTLERLDWAIIMLACIAAVLTHWQAVNWWRFTGAFLFPDLIGTAPGLYFYYARRSGTHRSIPPLIHKLYNFGHCFAVTALLCGLWWAVTGSLEWAMMAFPIHLAGDRSIFGNTYKPLGTSFEPVLHDAFKRFEEEYRAAGTW